MHRVLNVATRVVYGDFFRIRKWERTEDSATWDPTKEMFFITIHNLTSAQVNSENLRRYLAFMGDISSFSYPVRRANGRYSITVRASIRIRKSLTFTVRVENEMGNTNDLTFQFHHFLNNLCGYCNLIGHKIENCEQFAFDQQQAEEQQAAADAIIASMQQIDAQQHPEPDMMQQVDQQDMQQDMNFSEDSLASSYSEQAASEVTCTDYLKQLEEENASHDGIEVHGHCSAEPIQINALNVVVAPYFPNINMEPTLICGE